MPDTTGHPQAAIEAPRLRTSPYVQWFLYTFGASLLPLFFTAFVSGMVNVGASWMSLVSHGELYLISCSLAATAFGEFLVRKSVSTNDEAFLLLPLAFSALIVIAGSATCFTVVQMFTYFEPILRTASISLNMNMLANTSFVFLAFSIVVGVYSQTLVNPSR